MTILTEEERWEAWSRGEARCPICKDLADEDFEAVCDCSRYSLETIGRPLVIQVVGQPHTATVVIPEKLTAPSCTICGKELVATVIVGHEHLGCPIHSTRGVPR